MPRFSLLLAAALIAHFLQATVAAESVGKWNRWEHAFEADPQTPTSAEFQLQLLSPSGKKVSPRMYWDGGQTWKVRFMPDELGIWKYAIRGQKGLADQQGSFVCITNTGDTIFERHGPIQVSDNGRFLQHADGTPFFWLADTAWNGALLATATDWEEYLNDRQQKSFSAIQVVTTPWRTAYHNAEGQVAYTGRETIEIHPEFFQRIDARIDAINAHDMLAVPVILWALGEESYTPGKLPTDQAIRLARYIEARYGANHVAWFLGGDENYGGNRAEHWKKIGQAVFGNRPHAPATLHQQGMRWDMQSFADQKWVDFYIYQSGHGDSDGALKWTYAGPPAKQWNESPHRPIINSEPCYEGHFAYQSKQPHSAYNVRRACYWSLLSTPTAGVTYGAHGVWSWESQPGTPLNHKGSGLAKPWNEAMQLPGSAGMQHLAEMFTSIEWWTLVPENKVIAGSSANETPSQHIAAAASADGDLAVIYMPTGGWVKIDRTGLAAAKQFEWFDPRTGKRTAAQLTADGTFESPDQQDWVLIARP